MKQIILFIFVVIFISCNNYEGIDITEPSAVINSPNDGDWVTGNLIITAYGFDDIAVDYLELWINNINTGLVSNTSPYEFSIETNNYVDGTVLDIAVRAYDTSENASELSEPISVKVDNNYPNPVILNPIVFENDSLLFSWSKSNDEDFYAYVVTYHTFENVVTCEGDFDCTFGHYQFIDYQLDRNEREVKHFVTPGSPDSYYYYSVQVLDKQWEVKDFSIETFSNIVRPISFEFHTIPSGLFPFGEQNTNVFLDNSCEIMTTEVSNLQFSEYLNVANQLGLIDENIGPWVYDLEGKILYNIDEGKINWDGELFIVPSGFNGDLANHPVTFVTWYGADSFAKFFNYRLPTEKEWEKAARAGNNGDYPWGNDPNNENANFLGDSFDLLFGEIWPNTTPVKSYPANGGLFDMAGNVWEWIATDQDYYNSLRMIRGGSYKSPIQDLRCWVNDHLLGQHMSGEHIGFRCAR